MITLNKNAKEGSTYIIQIIPKDEENNSVLVNELTYTLTNENGDVINSLEDISITPALIINIVLTGDSLTSGWKILTTKGTYNSDYGSNLKLKDNVRFYVENLLEVDI